MAKIFVEEKLKNIDLSLKNVDTSISSRAPANTALSNTIYTNARAIKLDKLDNLDVSISSRAPASTALSNTVYTNARASNLDKLDTNVSTRARQDMLGLSTDVGTLKGLAYNENLHQKCADIIALSNDILTNTNNIAIKSGGGDFNGKTLEIPSNGFINLQASSSESGKEWIYSNPKGGILILNSYITNNDLHSLIVDDNILYENRNVNGLYWIITGISNSGFYIKSIIIPFSSYVKITIRSNSTFEFLCNAYINK